MNQGNFKVNTCRFGSTTEEEKENILQDCNAKNTNQATKSSLNCFIEYLVVKNLPEIDLLTNEQLPDVLLDFYTNMRTK